MPEVPRQRSLAAVARPRLKLGHLLALHRATRGDGRLVANQPAVQADQDRGARRAPRLRHHLPGGRGRRHRSDGPRHPRRYPPIASATAMRMIAIHAQTERKRLDRSVRCAEKRRRQASTLRIRGPIHPVPAVCATADAGRGEKRLSRGRLQAILTSVGRPLGECRLNSCTNHVTLPPSKPALGGHMGDPPGIAQERGLKPCVALSVFGTLQPRIWPRR